ncbi:hypothetical protein PHLGIDRAFT_131285 [Phlebiopsis gigantea 11061_1 CR5-6]|uniref:Survival protein SurE-like phosphatase/nucleotidase domain-containing protein n=1 Tax=Phlebiopsis gigantea (strain 11061_1 CR5-6) TaxID=745531 RepID=A0A0C3P9L5_PHLG1|nr:hypothetical protein PHLGIDRAFT_131285 [Phlebiopsis gigantea 11061_1 CR5-6]
MRGLCFIALLAILSATAERIVVTNDDGWAVAQIRAQVNALVDAGHDVILSAPADNQSGTGAMQKTAQPRTEPCEFDSCPPGAAMGNNASDSRLNWINAFPADSAQYGIQTLAPQLWDGVLPDFVVSGPNVGHNTGFSVFGSGTIGAAGKAVQLGVPAVAFSGTGTAHESYTALDIVPASATVSAAETYASLVTEFLDALFSQPPTSPPFLPANIMLNVNLPALDGACTAESVAWVLTRVFPVLLGNPDVVTCGNGGRLPVEGTVVSQGCFATVSAIDALLKVDVSKSVQQEVLDRLVNLGFSCV